MSDSVSSHSSNSKDFLESPHSRYEIESFIATGGMGAVYKAYDSVLKRTVVLKVFKSDRWTAQQFVRFQTEAKITSSLANKHIATIYDFGVSDKNAPYLVLEYIDGRDLSKILEEGPLAIDRAIKMSHQICVALAFAHGKGLIHRDLKPSNIMVLDSDDGEIVKIIDFGLAQQMEEPGSRTLTDSEVIRGSPPYLSPEQIRKLPLDNRSDIYSFGCLLFEMLSGYPPFRADSLLELLNLHLHEPPPVLADEEAEPWRKRLYGVISTCLVKDRDWRYDSIERVLDQLEMVATDFEDSDLAALAQQRKQLVDGREPNKSRTFTGLKLMILLAILLAGLGGSYYFVTHFDKKPSVKPITSLSSRLELDHPMILKDLLPTDPYKVSALDPPPELRLVKGSLKLTRVRLNESYLSRLSQYPIVQLEISQTNLTNEGLRSIGRISSLESLNISDSHDVTDEGLNNLSRLVKVEKLNLSGIDRLDGSGLRALKDLPIKCLWLSQCDNLQAEKMVWLYEYKHLQKLYRNHAGVTSKELEVISKIPTLDVLSLDKSDFEKGFVSQLAKFKQITYLSLRGAHLEKENLQELGGLSRLRILDLSYCAGVSDEQLGELKRRLPNASIVTANFPRP